jgi:MFS family permease
MNTPSPSPLASPRAAHGWTLATIAMFLAFAFAYFLSTLLRAVTATLAPTFRQELGLTAADLGLLAGAYFLGFSLTQLPLGRALDRFGPKRVQLILLASAALACLAFSQVTTLTGLVLSRMAIGVGVSACLMAPLTAYRWTLPAHQQLRANAWMLMTGSLGMLASTLPVHGLVPLIGWRGLFVVIAVLLVAAMGFMAWLAPGQDVAASVSSAADKGGIAPQSLGYRQIFAHPRFVQLLPAGLFIYGGMVAVQSLWLGPWLNQVVGQDAAGATTGLFQINLIMLCTFFTWGVVMPRLSARGVDSHRLVRWGMAAAVGLLALNAWLGAGAGVAMWTLWLIASSFVTLSQPLVAQEFPAALAGRALSAYNLVLFVGIFVVQWGIGLAVDALERSGWARVDAYRGAMALFCGCCALSFLWYLWRDRVAATLAAPITWAGDNPRR